MVLRRALLVLVLAAVALAAPASASDAYSGANGKLLFLRWNPANPDDLSGANQNEIWMSDVDGRRQSQATVGNFEQGGEGVASARWSPDGSLIAYATACTNKYQSHCSQIKIVRPDGHGKRTLDTPRWGAGVGEDQSPTWSADGARIAFNRDYGDDPGVFTVDTRGGGLTKLFDTQMPLLAWSPDGSRFAYWKSPPVYSGIGSVATVKVDGTDEVVLASQALYSAPDWSPDGKRVAFTQLRRNVAWVCVVPSAGGLVRCLVRGGRPAWSQDGRQLVYEHAHDIWVVRADGTHVRNVTRTPNGWESAPDW